jgi:hypothetical protein
MKTGSYGPNDLQHHIPSGPSANQNGSTIHNSSHFNERYMLLHDLSYNNSFGWLTNGFIVQRVVALKKSRSGLVVSSS